MHSGELLFFISDIFSLLRTHGDHAAGQYIQGLCLDHHQDAADYLVSILGKMFSRSPVGQ